MRRLLGAQIPVVLAICISVGWSLGACGQRIAVDATVRPQLDDDRLRALDEDARPAGAWFRPLSGTSTMVWHRNPCRRLDAGACELPTAAVIFGPWSSLDQATAVRDAMPELVRRVPGYPFIEDSRLLGVVEPHANDGTTSGGFVVVARLFGDESHANGWVRASAGHWSRRSSPALEPQSVGLDASAAVHEDRVIELTGRHAIPVWTTKHVRPGRGFTTLETVLHQPPDRWLPADAALLAPGTELERALLTPWVPVQLDGGGIGWVLREHTRLDTITVPCPRCDSASDAASRTPPDVPASTGSNTPPPYKRIQRFALACDAADFRTVEFSPDGTPQLVRLSNRCVEAVNDVSCDADWRPAPTPTMRDSLKYEQVGPAIVTTLGPEVSRAVVPLWLPSPVTLCQRWSADGAQSSLPASPNACAPPAACYRWTTDASQPGVGRHEMVVFQHGDRVAVARARARALIDAGFCTDDPSIGTTPVGVTVRLEANGNGCVSLRSWARVD